jgi:mono/diheme cytochrome c family protein
MTTRLIARSGVCALLALLVGMGSARAQSPDIGTDAQREAGKVLYMKLCSQCHGEKGDGAGYAKAHVLPKPRDFTSGKFKVRTSASGALPTHQDLVNIIRKGMPYTSMPAWPGLTDAEVTSLAYFITTFSAEFSNPQAVPKPIDLPSAPASTPESIETGKKLYEENGCVKCHGTLGRADGPSALTLKDDAGNPIRPANLTHSWTFRGGSSREDIFRTMSTGFNGTPMPSFAEALPADQRWAITDFIASLSDSKGPNYTNLIVAKPVQDPIDLTKGAESFAAAPVARFPLLGQITEPGRAFHPPATSVTVQAIYDAESVAFLVKWHDMRADKNGKNSPSLPVPPEEDSGGEAPSEAPAAAADADPFADTTESTVAPPAEFSDAVAVQFPVAAPAGARKPYFVFGDSQSSVDLWFFDLARETPLQFTGRGSADVAVNDAGEVTGVASYDQGEWSVIFKRPLRAASGAPFTPGQFMPIAFSAWDGSARERGNKRALSVWYSLYMEPETVPSAAGPMIRTALVIFGLELAIIGWVRSRYRSQARNEIRGEGRPLPATSS